MIGSFNGRSTTINDSARTPGLSGFGVDLVRREAPGAASSYAVKNQGLIDQKNSVINDRYGQEQIMSMLGDIALSLKRLLEQGGLSAEKPMESKFTSLNSNVEKIKKHEVSNRDSSQALFGLSGKTPGVIPENIWTGVMFSRVDNEPTLSAIKAAMMRFGQSPLGVYKSVTPTSDGYDIVMRDGFKVSLTCKELARAKMLAGFQHGATLEDGGMRKDVVFLYAASAKRAMLEGNNSGEMSFEAGLKALLANQTPEVCLKRLGMTDHMRLTSWAALKESGGIGVVAGGNTNFAYEGLLDGCTTQHSLPLDHNGQTYELI